MILSFTVLKSKLLSGKKTQTIRKESKLKVGDKLDIWWGHPKYRDKSIKKFGIGRVVDIQYKYGSEFIRKDALNDGFTTLRDLINGLRVIYKMSKAEVFEHKWAIIKWGWIDKYWIV